MQINDLSKFEEQILNYINGIETNLMDKINTKNSEINKSLNNFETKINGLLENNELVKEILFNHKIYKNKLTEFESFKNKADNMLISHEIRMQSNISDIDFLKVKYDKIITENLLVPGYIGPACQFKNLADFLSNTMIDLNKIKKDKDDRKKDVKELKSKFDNIMKSMISLNDGSIERCKDYTNHIQKDIINSVENKLKVFENKIFEIKTEVYKYNSINEQKILEINQKVLDIKKELYNILNTKIDEIKNNHLLLNDKIDINFKNIEKNSQDIKNLNNNINDLKIYLNENISNLNNLYLSLNNNMNMNNANNIQSQQNQGMHITTNTSPIKNIKNSVKTDLTKPFKLKSTKKINEKINITENNSSNKGIIQLKGLKNINNIQNKQLKDKTNENNLRKNKLNKDYDNNKDNYSENDNEEEISDLDNYQKNSKRILSSSNNSFEKPNKNKKNIIYNKYYSNKNLITYKNDLNSKNKIIPTDMNKYFKRETIDAKSTSQIKEEKTDKVDKLDNKKETIQRYKTKEINQNIQTPKNNNNINHHLVKSTIKSKGKKEYSHIVLQKMKEKEKEKEKEIEREKEKEKVKEKSTNTQNVKTEKKLKLNYGLINDIHKNNILDLYSFSTSPPDGKINLKYWTIDSLTNKFLKKQQKQYEIAKENGVNYKLVQIGGINFGVNDKNKSNNNSKNKVIRNSQSNTVQNSKNKFPIRNMKNKNEQYFSSGRMKVKNMQNNLATNKNSIIDIPPRIIFPFNKTFFENDNNNKDKNNTTNNNNDNMNLRNTMKELKMNENFFCLTYK